MLLLLLDFALNRGTFGDVHDEQKYFHLEPLDNENYSVSSHDMSALIPSLLTDYVMQCDILVLERACTASDVYVTIQAQLLHVTPLRWIKVMPST